MEKAPCWSGNILIVDLKNGKLDVENRPPEFYRKFGGGSGLGMYYILKHMPKGVDALSPENVLTIFSGPLTGLPISGNARISINAKSPARGAIGDSQAGGYFPASLKFSGFDGVVIKNRSDNPVYLYLNDGKAELRDASHLWGKLTDEVDEILKNELGSEKIEVLQCGIAGENLVRFASVMNMSNRACGRTGMGAVMGSKKLKAVVVNGTRRVEAFDRKKILELAKWGAKSIPENPDINSLSVYGTAGGVSGQNATGTLPSFNYNEGQFADYEKITGETISDTILIKTDTCYACAVHCKRVVETEFKGIKVRPVYGGPEYETICTLGTYCGISDINAISLGNQICNAFGMDTISAGASIAFAMECFENHLISEKDTDNLNISFGNADAMIKLLEDIALRKGFGNILAEGSENAAKIIDGKSADYLISVKGTEAPAHMPQAKKTLGIIYAVNPFGADHQSHEHDPFYEEGISDLARNRLAKLGLNNIQQPGSMNKEKIRFAYETQRYYSGLDTFDMCQFVFGPAWNIYGADEMIEALRAATGWDITIEEFLEVGERRLNMMRAFNQREGFDRSNDTLPRKFFIPLKGTGPTSGVFVDKNLFETHKDHYYQLAGWDIHSGNPSPKKLESLGLEWIAM